MSNVRFVLVQAEVPCFRCKRPHLEMSKAPLVDGVIGDAPGGSRLCPLCERRDRDLELKRQSLKADQAKWVRRAQRKLKRAKGRA